MRFLLLCALTTLAASTGSAQNILNNSDHVSVDAYTAVFNLANPSIFYVPGGIYVDQTCISGSGSPGSAACSINGAEHFVEPATLIADATNPSAALYRAGDNSGRSYHHTPYAVLNQSSGGYSLAGDEQANYAAIEAASLIYVFAYCGRPVAGDYPPVAFSTVLPNIIPAQPLGTTGCGYAQGIEFSVPVDAGVYNQCVQPRNAANNPNCVWTPCPSLKNGQTCDGTRYANAAPLDVESPSATTEALSGVMAVLKRNHPSWTWGDVKSVLRTTASCWNSGYAVLCGSGSSTGFGYGNVNFLAANSYTGTIYLQPPGMRLSTPTISGNAATYTVTLYPFLQTRRVGEAVYVGGTWPSPASGCGGSTCNEYTAAQIAAAGGRACVSNGTAVTPTFTCKVSLPSQGAIYVTSTFVALTLDVNGNGSRVESFMPKSGAR
jgi:hypothetical protein